MSSLKQQEASRANGAKSRGPASPEGKSIASKNSITHGLYSRSIVIPGESPEAYDAHVQGFLHQFQPINPFELDLVRDLAAAQWQLQRARAIENQLLSEAVLNVSGTQQASLSDIAAGFASVSASPAFEKIERHQIRLTRLYSRALNSLLKCRKDRPLAGPLDAQDETVQNEPEPQPQAGPVEIQAEPAPQNTQNEPEPPPQPEPKFIHPAIVNGHPTFYAVKDPTQPGGLRFIHPKEASDITNSRS